MGEKPPDLSFASLQLGGVLQSSDKLKLRPILRQFLLIIFDTFFSSLSLETFNDGVRQQHDDWGLSLKVDIIANKTDQEALGKVEDGLKQH